MSVEMYFSREHKARKVHQCYGCKRDVEIGEQYRRTVGVWDGDFYSVAEHIECHDLDTEMFKASGADSDEWAGMWDEIQNGEYPLDDPFRIRFESIMSDKRTVKQARPTS